MKFIQISSFWIHEFQFYPNIIKVRIAFGLSLIGLSSNLVTCQRSGWTQHSFGFGY